MLQGAHLLPPPPLARRGSPLGSRSRCLHRVAARLTVTGCLHCWHCQLLQQRRLTCRRSATWLLRAEPGHLIKHVQTRTYRTHACPDTLSKIVEVLWMAHGHGADPQNTALSFGQEDGRSFTLQYVGDAWFGSSKKNCKFVQVLSCSSQRPSACQCLMLASVYRSLSKDGTTS